MEVKMENSNKGLPNGYKPLIAYNGYVLAEKDFEHSESKKQYVTWMQNDRGVTLGHYFTERTAAEEDFAVRTELINPNKLFNADELAVLYKALNDFDAAGNFDYENKTLCSIMENAREKLESIPDVDIEKYSKIKVLIIEPGQEPRPAEIINDLYTLQGIVDGYIEITHPNDDGGVVVISNEEGKLRGLPSNREINGNMYVGMLVVAGCNDNGEFCSLSSLQSEAYKQYFAAQDKSDLNRVSKANNLEL
jgi:hypothetical protein